MSSSFRAGNLSELVEVRSYKQKFLCLVTSIKPIDEESHHIYLPFSVFRL